MAGTTATRTCSGCRLATRAGGALTMTHRRILVAGGLSLALLAAACHEDELFTPLPPAYAGGSGVKSSSSWQAAARSARLKPPATRMRRCVIVRAPPARVAKRHPEQVRVAVVPAIVHPGR